MKKLIFLLMLISYQGSFCQSKAETENWVLNKLNQYSNEGIAVTSKSFAKDIFYRIEGDLLVADVGNRYSEYAPINELINYSYKILEESTTYDVYLPKGVIITLMCKNGHNCIYSKDMKSQKKFSFINELKIIMDGDFSDNDLPERMKRAFNNLIRYHGGTIEVEKY